MWTNVFSGNSLTLDGALSGEFTESMNLNLQKLREITWNRKSEIHKWACWIRCLFVCNCAKIPLKRFSVRENRKFFLRKNFVKSIYIKFSMKMWFHGIFANYCIIAFPQCGKTRNSLPRNFFPSNQFIVKFFSKTLIWRNFCEKIVAIIVCNFHSVWPCFIALFHTELTY